VRKGGPLADLAKKMGEVGGGVKERNAVRPDRWRRGKTDRVWLAGNTKGERTCKAAFHPKREERKEGGTPAFKQPGVEV